ncbi:MAG TPA: RIP metalloprotease RseP [Planctomycetota bacterium]|nr:RIP metalloprotease RseP [Planctomycetota bacterium]
MQQITQWLSNGWSIVLVVLGLGLIIFLHELGHFLMAKKNKVRVEIFSLGFGQAIFKFRRGETEYRIAWLPLGGYVKMAGETMLDERKGEPFELTSKTPWQRFQIFVAGAVMNLIIAFPIAILSYVIGKVEVPNEIGRPGLAEVKAGIQPGDVILEVGGRKIDSLEKLRVEMIRRPNGTMVPVKIKRGEEILTKQVESMRSSYHESIQTTLMMLPPPAGKPLYEQGVREKDEIVSVNGRKVYMAHEGDAALKECVDKDAVLEIRHRGPTFEDDDKLRKVTVHLPKKTWYVIPIDENLMEPRVGMVMDHRPAADLLEPDDLILQIGDETVRSWAHMKSIVEKAASVENPNGTALRFKVQRGEDQRVVTITPIVGSETGKGYLGIGPKSTSLFAEVKPGTFFDKAGLKSGDVLVAVDGQAGTPTLAGNPKSKIPAVFGVREDKPRSISIEVERKGQRVKLDLVAEAKDEGDLTAAGFPTGELGGLSAAGSQPYRRRAFGDAVKMGFEEPVDITVMTVDILKKVITGGESAKGFSGPIGIMQASYGFAQRAFGNFLWLLCLITVNLGIFNLLPIPILDGGHNVLLLIEVVRKWFGKPPPGEKFIAAFQYVGLAFILTLFVFVTFNDISRLIRG